LTRARKSCEQKYLDWTEKELLQGYRSFAVDAHAEAGAAARRAVDEFRLEVEAFPPVFRRRIERRRLDEQAEWLRSAVAAAIPPRADKRKNDLEAQFRMNCSKASRAVVNEGKKRLSRWPSRSRQRQAEWIGLFSDAVRYDDLPPELQRLVIGPYLNWNHETVAQLREEIEWRCTFWGSVMKSIATVVGVFVVKVFWDLCNRN
jgi:hypothetical protein